MASRCASSRQPAADIALSPSTLCDVLIVDPEWLLAPEAASGLLPTLAAFLHVASFFDDHRGDSGAATEPPRVSNAADTASRKTHIVPVAMTMRSEVSFLLPWLLHRPFVSDAEATSWGHPILLDLLPCDDHWKGCRPVDDTYIRRGDAAATCDSMNADGGVLVDQNPALDGGGDDIHRSHGTEREADPEDPEVRGAALRSSHHPHSCDDAWRWNSPNRRYTPIGQQCAWLHVHHLVVPLTRRRSRGGEEDAPLIECEHAIARSMEPWTLGAPKGGGHDGRPPPGWDVIVRAVRCAARRPFASVKTQCRLFS